MGLSQALRMLGENANPDILATLVKNIEVTAENGKFAQDLLAATMRDEDADITVRVQAASALLTSAGLSRIASELDNLEDDFATFLREQYSLSV